MIGELTIHRDHEQRSAAWHAARCGMVTASTVARLITVGSPGAYSCECPECGAAAGQQCVSLRGGTPIKTTHSQRVSLATEHAATSPPVITIADNDTARSILTTLAAERLTGLTEDTPVTSDMWRGINAEPFAREAYAATRGVEVEEVGLMVRDFGWSRLGYSSDGLVGDAGLIEIKAPRAKGHIDTVLNDEIPGQHMAQLQTGLLVSGRAWIDYVSFSGGLHLWCRRVEPEQNWRDAILAALAHAEDRIADIASRYLAAVEGLPATDPLPTFDDITI